jgi:hypothetical protein
MHFIKLKSRTVVGRKNSVCGTSADGPYQAYEFGFTIQEETGRHRIPEEFRFFQAVLWDATHLLNLGATDIKEGKFGESQEFFTNFIKRANEFNHMMGTGKGFAQLELSAKNSSKVHLGGGGAVAPRPTKISAIVPGLEGTTHPDSENQLNAISCIKDKSSYLAMGRKDFQVWFRYIISLPHVQKKKDKLHYLDVSCSDALYHRFKECVC